VPAVTDAHRAAHAEAALGEIQPVAHVAAHAVVPGIHFTCRWSTPPCRMKSSTSRPDRVVGEGGDDGGAQAEAAAQAAGHVVFAAAFPGAEGAGGVDALLAGIEAQHDFAQRDFIPQTIGRLDVHQLLSFVLNLYS
jgi:hypothetical protein